MQIKREIISFLLVPLIFGAPLQAHAVLGGGSDTVSTDRKAFSATRRTSVTRDGYRVEEFTFGATNVREYVSSAGIVFAIAWNGYTHPDLAQLLGSYSKEYEAARQNTPRVRGRHQQHISTGNVVVETWGHMRNLAGRAYAPNLVPSGVTTDEIK